MPLKSIGFIPQGVASSITETNSWIANNTTVSSYNIQLMKALFVKPIDFLPFNTFKHGVP